MNSLRRTSGFSLLAATALCLAFTAGVHAQVKTKTSSTAGQPRIKVHAERGEVIRIDGNDLLVKMEDGSLRHFNNVPESATVTVNGKELGIHDLKPGMKLERTSTTTTTPETVTTVKTVAGTVWHVNPPNFVTLHLEDGTTQSFNIPRDQEFTVNGQQTDAWGLNKGMKISATKVVEEPQTVVEHQRQVTGSMPAPPIPPPSDQPILIAVISEVPNPAAAPAPTPAPAPVPAQEPALPKTGSLLPLVGLLGALALAIGVGLRAARAVWRAQVTGEIE
jgi:RNase P/RNase MRP subunit p29